MVQIRGNDTYTGIEIAPEQTWGTAAVVNWERVAPLLEDTFVVEADPLPRSQQFGLGGQPLSNFDQGRQLVRGSFSFYPSYNGRFQHYLLGQFNGGIEMVVGDRLPNGATATGAHSHVYEPQPFNATAAGSVGGIGNGFTVRAWRSGQTNTGYCDTFTGCIATRLIMDQPDLDRPKWTVEFLGYRGTTTQVGQSGGPSSRIPASPTGNNGAAAWSTHANAYTDDTSFATTTTNASPVQYSAFGNLAAKAPSSALIQGIIVSVKGKKTDSGGTSTLQFDVELSWDGGTTWTTGAGTGVKTTSNLTASDATYTVGGAADTWGRSWTLAEIVGSFRVRITSRGSVTGTPTWHLQYLVVTAVMLDTALRDPQSDLVEVQLRDYNNRTTDANCPGIVKLGQHTGSAHNLTSVSTRGYKFTFDGHYDVPPPFLTAIDSSEKPGHVDKWECSGEIRSFLEQDYDAANRVHNMYRNRQDGCIRIRYVSTSNITGVFPYVLDIFIPKVAWVKSPNPIDDINPQSRWEFTAVLDGYGIQGDEWAVGVVNPVFVRKDMWMISLASGTASAMGYSIAPEGEDLGSLLDFAAPEQSLYSVPFDTTFAATTATPTDWTGETNALADGGGYASSTTEGGQIIFGGFDTSDLDASAFIDSINVRLDALKDESLGSGILELSVSVSWDGGTSWTTATRTGALTTGELTYWIGGGEGRFGRDWLGTEVTTANLKVKVATYLTSGVDVPEWRLDYVAVRIRGNSVPPVVS